MSGQAFSDQDAQASREQWFRFLDEIESARTDLHAYCHRLTHTVWDAEDLVQETLLKGFAMTARGDLHGEESPVNNIRAYLFRVATNHWIDAKRKAQREVQQALIEVPVDDDLQDVNPAIERALQLASPQEFAALILKEGFDFSLEEIADFVGTSVGTVKSALSRGRRKMANSETATYSTDPESKRVAKQFADAINRQDLPGLLALMAESMNIVVCNVGGGRGRDGIWTEQTVKLVSAESFEYQGEALVVFYTKSGKASDIVRIEADAGEVVRLTDYCYAPQTLSHVADALGITISTIGYHQPPKMLVEMIATTTLPWRAPA